MNGVKLGVCEIAVRIDESDGDEMVAHAHDLAAEWVEETMARPGDYAAIWDAMTESWVCWHVLESEDLAEEILDLIAEHEMKIGDKIMLARPLVGAAN